MSGWKTLFLVNLINLNKYFTIKFFTEKWIINVAVGTTKFQFGTCDCILNSDLLKAIIRVGTRTCDHTFFRTCTASSYFMLQRPLYMASQLWCEIHSKPHTAVHGKLNLDLKNVSIHLWLQETNVGLASLTFLRITSTFFTWLLLGKIFKYSQIHSQNARYSELISEYKTRYGGIQFVNLSIIVLDKRSRSSHRFWIIQGHAHSA